VLNFKRDRVNDDLYEWLFQHECILSTSRQKSQ
jgi:hypothetical protein